MFGLGEKRGVHDQPLDGDFEIMIISTCNNIILERTIMNEH